MDDPIFDPWSRDEDSPSAETRRPQRWRFRGASAPTFQAGSSSSLSPPERNAPRTPRARLAGTPGFLRTLAVPRLEEAAQRLTMARHQAFVEDLLDASPPVVRLTLKPWQAPLASGRSAEGRLLIGLPDPNGETVSLSYDLGDQGEPVVEHVPAARLSGTWLEFNILAFIGRVLDEA